MLCLPLLVLALGAAAVELKGPPRTPFLDARQTLQAPVRRAFDLKKGINLNEHGPFCFTQKVSHFDKSQNGTFCHRYQVDKTFYKPGGPVIFLDGGEYSHLGDSALSEYSIESPLAQAHGALVVKLEHRYYGYSFPVPDLTTDNMRFLTIEESLEDTANFIRNFPTPAGLDAALLKPDAAPWFYVAGSYPGARAAWFRSKYPDLIYGALASSAGLKQTTDLQGLYTRWAKWYDPRCGQNFELAIRALDAALDKKNQTLEDEVKAYFYGRGLDNWRFAWDATQLTTDLQARSWRVPESEDAWSVHAFCQKMVDPGPNITIGGEQFPGAVKVWRRKLYPNKHGRQGCGNITDVGKCLDEQGDLYSLNVPPNTKLDPDDFRRPWLFQNCLQLGFIPMGVPEGSPQPRLVSKYLTREHFVDLCHHWFPPGKHYQLPAELPDPSGVAKLNGPGDFNYPRIIWTNGEWDPWAFIEKPEQPSTPENPYYFIREGGHCWDLSVAKNLDEEPEYMQTVHRGIIADIGRWVKEFHDEKNSTSTAGN